VVRLLLLRCADVARYCLPDHRISPSPRSLSADFNASARSFPSLVGEQNRAPQAEQARAVLQYTRIVQRRARWLFLKKKATRARAFGVQQLENRYIPIAKLWELPSFLSSLIQGKGMSSERKETGDESILNREMKRRPEMERRGGFS
jgi:hypothetical protein